MFKPTYGTLRRIFSKTCSAAGLSRSLNTQSNLRDDPAGTSGPYRKALAAVEAIRAIQAIEEMPADNEPISQGTSWPVRSEMADVSRE